MVQEDIGRYWIASTAEIIARDRRPRRTHSKSHSSMELFSFVGSFEGLCPSYVLMVCPCVVSQWCALAVCPSSVPKRCALCGVPWRCVLAVCPGGVPWRCTLAVYSFQLHTRWCIGLTRITVTLPVIMLHSGRCSPGIRLSRASMNGLATASTATAKQ